MKTLLILALTLLSLSSFAQSYAGRTFDMRQSKLTIWGGTGIQLDLQGKTFDFYCVGTLYNIAGASLMLKVFDPGRYHAEAYMPMNSFEACTAQVQRLAKSKNWGIRFSEQLLSGRMKFFFL